MRGIPSSDRTLMICALALATLLAATPEPKPAEPPAVTLPQMPQTVSHAIVADLGLHILGVAYHHGFSERVIGSLGVALYVPWTFTQNSFGLSGTYRSDLAGLVLRARVYFLLWHGLWISPFIQGGAAKATEAGGTVFGGVGAAGVSVGYAKLFWDHLLIAAGLGIQVHGAWIGAGSPPSFLGAWPAIDLVIGYLW